jgi:hypothetical protein
MADYKAELEQAAIARLAEEARRDREWDEAAP